MGILHFIGLKDKHKGIFKDLSIDEAIQFLEQQDSDFSLVIQSLVEGFWGGTSCRYMYLSISK